MPSSPHRDRECRGRQQAAEKAASPAHQACRHLPISKLQSWLARPHPALSSANRPDSWRCKGRQTGFAHPKPRLSNAELRPRRSPRRPARPGARSSGREAMARGPAPGELGCSTAAATASGRAAAQAGRPWQLQLHFAARSSRRLMPRARHPAVTAVQARRRALAPAAGGLPANKDELKKLSKVGWGADAPKQLAQISGSRRAVPRLNRRWCTRETRAPTPSARLPRLPVRLAGPAGGRAAAARPARRGRQAGAG